MNLIIDIGNTLTKFSVFSDGKIIKSFSSSKASTKQVKAILIKYPKIQQAIVSSVVNKDAALIRFLKRKLRTCLVVQEAKFPFKNKYKTPNTLGTDRVAAVAGAILLFPKQNILIVDAGSCIKLNFINAKGEFLGGAISPGIRMRFKAMHIFTGKLPLIQALSFNDLIGKNTRESMLVGGVTGAVAEVDSMIRLYAKEFSGLRVILTGGDASFFENKLKNPIFTHPNLIAEGLNSILNHNFRNT